MKKHLQAPGILYFFVHAFTVTHTQTDAVYSIGINAGTFIYQGDLTPWGSGSLKTPSLVIGFTGAKKITPSLSARLDLNVGSLRGDDAKYSSPEFRRQRAFAFKSRATEVVASAVYYPTGHQYKLSPYVVAGIGYSFLKIRRDYSRFNAEYFTGEPTLAEGLTADIAHSLPRGTFVAPVGLGVQYALSERFSLNSEASYRLMSNDYLDGFSKAANPARGDHYYKYSVGLLFHLGVKDKYACPVMRY